MKGGKLRCETSTCTTCGKCEKSRVKSPLDVSNVKKKIITREDYIGCKYFAM